jgi:hypothetical protein
MTIFSCNDNNHVIIIGHTQNAKAGAIVIEKDSKKMYYLDGLSYWNSKDTGRLIKVTGILIIENNNQKSDTLEVRQETMGLKRIINKSKWEFIN